MHSHGLAVSKFQFGVCAGFITFSVWTYQATPVLWLGQVPRGGPRVPSWPGSGEFRPGGRRDTCRGGACCPRTGPLFSAWFRLGSRARAHVWLWPWGWSREPEGQPEPLHTPVGTGLIGRMQDFGRHLGRPEVDARRKEAKRRVRKVQSGGGTRDTRPGRPGRTRRVLGSRCSARLVQDARFPQTRRRDSERERRDTGRGPRLGPLCLGGDRKASSAVTR